MGKIAKPDTQRREIVNGEIKKTRLFKIILKPHDQTYKDTKHPELLFRPRKKCFRTQILIADINADYVLQKLKKLLNFIVRNNLIY